MNKNLTTIILFTFILFQGSYVYAKSPYKANILVSTESASVGATNLVDLSNDLKTAAIVELIPVYTPTSQVAIGINLRGLDVISGFAANSTELQVLIPQAGITTSFTGATRDESVALFKIFIKEDANKIGLLRAYSKYSPIDPIAGNPNSLMAQMAQSDYLIGVLSPQSGCDYCWSAQPIVHQFQTGLSATRGFSKGFDTTSIVLPVRYSYAPNLDWALIIDLPLAFNDNGGAYSVFGSLGVGVRFPITHEWSLTPNMRLGAGGSLDLTCAGDFFSSGLTSTYNYKFCDYVLSMTNYAGYYTSMNLWLTGINFNYQLHNYILKNGLNFTSCEGYTFCNRPVNFNLSFTDSDFEKDRLYINHYDEIGLSLIMLGVNPCIDYDCLSIGFAYQFGQKSYKGYNLKLTYQF